MAERIENKPEVQLTIQNGRVVKCQVVNLGGDPDQSMSTLRRYITRQLRISTVEMVSSGFFGVLGAYELWTDISQIVTRHFNHLNQDPLDTVIKVGVGLGCTVGAGILARNGHFRGRNFAALKGGIKSGQFRIEPISSSN